MSQAISSSTIMRAFSVLPDPRKPRNQLYSLFDIVSTSILGALCTSDDYEEIAFWAESNLEWLQSVGICLKGAPSHDTYERFFKCLDPKALETCFVKWTQLVADTIKGVIALDGKTVRNSGNRATNTDPIHMVSAFAAENGLVLGQLTTSGKGKELETFDQLLDILNLKEATVTIDAGGCHKIIAEKVHSKGGDYLLGLKGNQGKLHFEAENFFSQAMEVEPGLSECDYWCGEERTRGRSEKREVWACDKLDWLPQLNEWEGLRSLVCVKTTKVTKDKTCSETRYFISSHQADAEHLGKASRQHWAIENQLHWQLDVTFREDFCRVRTGHGATNLSVLRRAVLNILRANDSAKMSMKKKRLKACWDHRYLLELLGIK